jgi:hypothetical protein
MDPTDTSRGPSPIIWADFPSTRGLHEGGDIIHHYDDFLAPNDATWASADSNGYFMSVGTGCTITQVDDETGATGQDESLGLAELLFDGTADDGVMLSWPLISGATAAHQGYFRANGSTDKCYFECRIKTTTVADQGLSFFAGLAEGGAILASATLVDTTHIWDVDKSFIGFGTLPADGDSLLAGWQEGDGTRVNSSTTTTIAANTYYKLGFRIDGPRLRMYVDGAAVYAVNDVTDLTDWPDSDRLSLLIGGKVGTAAAAADLHVDWVRAGWVGR